MAGFDAQRYLRLTAERWIRQRHGAGGLPWDPVLVAAAAALVAVGAATPEAVRPVIDDYHEALALRESQYRNRMSRPAARHPTGSAPPRVGQFRVVPCERTIDRPGGRLTLHYVAFTDHATTLRATVQPGLRWLTITDDHGTTSTAQFSGGTRRGDSAWHGQYELDPLLAADTAWIELLGERIELTSEPPASQVRSEPLPAQDPAVRHLWERVATLNDFHDPHLALDAAVAALVAAGALHAEDPVIGDARAVLAALRPAGDESGPRCDHPPPEPWRSLLARWRRTGGPVGSTAVGALTPAFGGVRAGVIALESFDYGFSARVELVPGARVGLPYRDLPDQQYLTWWAADDLGHHYLGEHGTWYAGDDWSGGTILFWPALDVRARSVEIMPTGSAERAVISVPLPWARPR